MTIEETKKLLKLLRINYPNSFSKLEDDETYIYLQMFYEAFKDDDVALVTMAVKSIIYSDTREFAPNIAQIKEKMFSLKCQDFLDEQRAWNIVKKAIARSGWHSEEEFNKLPNEIKSIVDNANQLKEWSQMDSDDINTIVASNFMRNYRNIAKKTKELELLPNQVKKEIENLNFIALDNKGGNDERD